VIPVVAALFGLVIRSFLNVLIHRVPIRLAVVAVPVLRGEH
jgi:prepilin signal peptidase PulO-like enzyme (type II secretory pathway)